MPDDVRAYVHNTIFGPSAATQAARLLLEFDEDQILTLLCLAARYAGSPVPDQLTNWDWESRPELEAIGRIVLALQNSRHAEPGEQP